MSGRRLSLDFWNTALGLAAFSAFGFACKYFRISRPAILLGFILSSKVEEYSYQLYDMYDFNQVITRPFVIVVIVLAILMVLFSRKIKVDYV